jgi:hypothetical protein
LDPNKSHQVDESYDKKAMARIDVKDIERIVFSATENVYGEINGGKRSQQPQVPEYVEEESYVNPPHVDSQSDLEEEDRRSLRAILKTREDPEYGGEIERNTIKLNYNDICIDEPSSHLSIAEEPIII